jgi:hypothetical protein
MGEISGSQNQADLQDYDVLQTGLIGGCSIGEGF